MTKLEIVNEVLRTTGVGVGVNTLAGLDPSSDAGRVVSFVEKARVDVSRKVPQASLRKLGAITLVPRVGLASLFSDMDGDSEPDNALVVIEGESLVSGVADNPLQVDEAWNGRLFHVQGDSHAYRVSAASAALGRLTLVDFSGSEVGYLEDTKSLDSSGVAKSRAANWAATDTYPTAYVGQDRYLLPSDFKMPEKLDSFIGGEVRYRPAWELDTLRYGSTGVYVTWGDPQFYTIRGTSGGRFYVEVWPVPIVAQSLPFSYEAGVSAWVDEDEPSGYPSTYEEALISRARWYVYRFLKKSETDVQIEEGVWREVFTDQQKNPLTSGTQLRIQPETSREYWGSVYNE